MNSLNLLSARVIGTKSSEKPKHNRSRSYSEGNLEKSGTEGLPKRSSSQHIKREITPEWDDEKEVVNQEHLIPDQIKSEPGSDETSPLLSEHRSAQRSSSKQSKLRLATKRLVDALTASIQWVLAALAAPGVYVFKGLCDEKGQFSPSTPIRKLSRLLFMKNQGVSTSQAVGLSGSSDTSNNSRKQARKAVQKEAKRRSQDESRADAVTSESEADLSEKTVLLDRPLESRPRLPSSSSSEEVPQTRRSIRIKLYNEDSTRRRKQRRDKDKPMSSGNDTQPALTVQNIKSPTSPTSSLRMTKYPRSPAPPRPLIPRRQPSYSSPPLQPNSSTQKTLIIDLDETLIHSMAKGGRMSSGHMVEVKLNTNVGYGGTTLGPQHPILYYVHKRPHCDDFLRRVCKWYNLVVFTASVQEYADPVIDWLEQERQYFSGRYYRQHCTYRNGAYIKDLSSVEPDLSKVMILDNSPLSYIFHEGMLDAPNPFE